MYTMSDTKQTTIRIDPEWQQAIDALAKKLGFRTERNVTQVLRFITMRTYLHAGDVQEVETEKAQEMGRETSQ